jgi:hypothetical protein
MTAKDLGELIIVRNMEATNSHMRKIKARSQKNQNLDLMLMELVEMLSLKYLCMNLKQAIFIL